MAARKTRPEWDLGRKVARLLQERAETQDEPTNPTALARLIPIDPGAVMDWIRRGASPRSKTGRRIAEILGVDPGWLLDDTAGWPPPKNATSLDALLRLIPADQRERLITILRDPAERAAWIAAWEARRGPRS